MDPRPPVDRRTVLRGAAAIAGVVAAGTMLGAGEGVPTANPAAASGLDPAGSRPKGGAGARPTGTTKGGPGKADPVPGKQPKDKPAGHHPNSPEPTAQGAESSPTPDGDPGRPANDGNTHPDSSDSGGGQGGGGQGDGGGNGNGQGDPGGSGDGGGGGGGDPGQPPLVAVSEVPVGGGVVVAPARVVVTQPVSGTFRCFGSRCTHAGCLVDAVTDGTIHCPCHGSLFDMLSGEPVAGPAPSALDQVAIKVKSGGVYLA